MNALDERIRTHIDSLAAPITIDEVTHRSPTFELDGRSSRRPGVAIAAGIIAAAGLAAVTVVASRDTDQATSSTPATPATAEPPAPPVDRLDDPMRLDLDGWIVDAEPSPAQEFWVLDTTQLPAGYTLVDAAGYTMLDTSSMDSANDQVDYRWMASMQSDSGDVIALTAERSVSRPDCAERLGDDAVPVEVDGGPALLREPTNNAAQADRSGASVCWVPHPGVIVMVESSAATSDDIDIVDIARSLTFATTDTLPHPEPAPSAAGVSDDPTFAGNLNGLAWTATVDAGDLRAMGIATEQGHRGAFSNDRLSQPTALAVADVEGHITGVPGYGAIVYGVGPQGATAVVVTATNGHQAELPLHTRPLETFFAIPIPEPVQIETLRFVADDNTTLATVDVPRIPSGLEGTYGGVLIPH